MLIYVAPDPETLGVIGKEQNDTFVLPIDAAGGEAGGRREACRAWPLLLVARRRAVASSRRAAG